MLNIDAIVDILTDDFYEVLEQDCLGEMMESLDGEGITYGLSSSKDIATQNEGVRNVYKIWVLREVEEAIGEAKKKAIKRLFGKKGVS